MRLGKASLVTQPSGPQIVDRLKVGEKSSSNNIQHHQPLHQHIKPSCQTTIPNITSTLVGHRHRNSMAMQHHAAPQHQVIFIHKITHI
jgi:hypothetical protein